MGVCLASTSGPAAAGTFSPRPCVAGIGAGMAIERAAKRETALMRMGVVFIFFFFLRLVGEEGGSRNGILGYSELES